MVIIKQILTEFLEKNNNLFKDDNILSILLKNQKTEIIITSIIVNKRKIKIEQIEKVKYREIQFEEVSKKDLKDQIVLLDKINFVKKFNQLYSNFSEVNLENIIQENHLNIKK